ncbi:uncharacterized protein BYT42DRAFT_602293 [Radiomyces spectabilis]|uniref:uncharacterized protein n=1 Tax=Radiomyces spectabilis TaxID=64574 RepID=UPI00221F08D3|nr:uncharacterized protein BYT42DRAFT_602293 [Radiomyces spectabilis]KAI8391462.1 hypothetical protein BYT42DRAFT_602293 [Radiomyces spectabilis]
MGNKISNVTSSMEIDSFLTGIGDIYYERSIGRGRFLKTIRGRHKDTVIVVKIFIKPEIGMSLRNYVKRLQSEYDALLDIPNVFFFQRVLETDRAAYLIRQYFYSSLYDRISTRPFLTLIEKKWIAYQILRGIADAHAKKVYHGDMKTENVLMTSWNWIYIVDFASFKPTYLPEDNPADYSFFFDTSSRRTCYIAPERFYKAGSEIEQKMKNVDWMDCVSELTPEMDIFSVGCVIAEFFLEGSPLFSLSQLFKYRNGNYDPTPSLEKIEDKDIRDMVRHMIQIDPSARYSAERYLSEWRGKAFPHYFYTFIHQYISSITDKCDHIPTTPTRSLPKLPSAFPGVAPLNKRLTDADEKIERIYHDFDKIAYFISAPTEQAQQSNTKPTSPTEARPPLLGERRRTLTDLPNTTASAVGVTPHWTNIILPPTLNIPNYEPDQNNKTPDSPSYETNGQGSLIFLSFVSSLVQNTSYPSSKLKALDILLALSEHLPDDVKLDRLLPYLMTLLTDESSLVRASAIKTLTQVLCMVESISPINARIFPEYIMPSVREFVTDPDVLVRTTYASCIALLAETALRFLEMTQLIKTDKEYPRDQEDENPDLEESYDSSLQALQGLVQEQVTILLIDSESSVKRALLTNITCLCVFFGRQKTNDILLSHIITYLNDKDWMLRSAFFECIKGVGTFVGAQSLEQYILPLMTQALTDAEEFVVEKVLTSLTSLGDLGLFQKMKLWELIAIIAPLTCHPSVWIRYGAISFIASTEKYLPQTDLWCIIYPLLKPFLKSDIAEINEACLLENLKSPIPRQVYEQAITWASKSSGDSLFWRQQRDKRVRTGQMSLKNANMGPAMLIRQGSLFSSFTVGEQVRRSTEDDAYLDRLRSVGMTSEDEDKLMLMREYIFKVSQSKLSRPKSTDDFNMQKDEIYLKNLGVTPMTVFLPDISKEAHQWSAKVEKPAIRKISLDDQPCPSDVNAKKTTARADVYKLSRVASQPHVQALMSNIGTGAADKPMDQELKQPSSSASAPHTTNPQTSTKAKRASTSSKDNRERSPDALELRSMDRQNGTVATLREPAAINSYRTIESSLRKPSAGYGHLQNLLFKIAMGAFPPHMPEFTGDPAIMKRIRRLPQGTSPFRTISNWKPEGTLVAHFTQHTAAINQLVISWDNLLFASCSDDGSVKIWDCSRLERNVTNRARATYNQQGGRIKCLTFIQQTYSIAAASDNGSIHVFRVDIRNAGSGLKFGKCVTVREYQLEDEFAVVIKHFTSNASNTMAGSKSILLFATTKGAIYAMDLLTMGILWKLQNPKSHGVITSMLTDRLHTWLLVGTTRGILTFYDLRFQIPLRSWLHPSKSRINAMILNHDPKAESKQVIIAAGKNEISLWDIVKLKCLEVFVVKHGDEKHSGPPSHIYQPLEAPTDEEILEKAFTDQEASIADYSVRAIVSPSDCRFIISGDSDRRLRFWDTVRVEHSAIVLGLDYDEVKPRYSTYTQGDIKFNVEYTQPHRSATGMGHSSRASSTAVNPASANAAMIQQQSLMRNHTDAITDVILTEVPYPMIISGDRDGVIKIVS